MASVVAEIRSGAYFDSVVLMQLQRKLLELDGVLDAGVVMATAANKALLEERELLTERADAAGSDDLLLVVRADQRAKAEAALGQVDDLIAQRRQSAGPAFQHKSLSGAAAALPAADWVLISVPGRYAAGVARQALELNKNVFLYSDNVELDDEIELKQTASRSGLMVMGPDCGTAIINGIGLGFANRVQRGPIGIVAASGTGLQAISSRIDRLGSGVSQAFGTGGRDLKQAVGAVTARQALDLLGRDAATEVIVLVSKPPAPAVATDLLTAAAALPKPVVVQYLGLFTPLETSGNLIFARNLDEAAELAVAALDRPGVVEAEQLAVGGNRPYVRGLFSGGTLAYEALAALSTRLQPIYSNIPIEPEQTLEDPLTSQAHTILDLGEDVFTVGRLHPMMDNDLRLRRLEQEAAQLDVGVILLDVVLGEGSHPDPAAELAPAIEAVTAGGDIAVAVVLIGTDEDPQDRKQQAERFTQAGAVVYDSALQACTAAANAVSQPPSQLAEPLSLEWLERPLAGINVGLETFYDSLVEQGAEAVHVDWRPPAGGDKKLMDLLAQMK